MDDSGVEILSQTVNMPVLHMHGRKFPGVLIQGDTLSSLFALSRMIHSKSKEQSDVEIVDLAEEMMNELSELLEEYERVLKAHDRPLPYVSPLMGRK